VGSDNQTREVDELAAAPRSVLRGLARLGVDGRAVLSALDPGTREALCGEPKPQHLRALWQAAVESSGEPALGIRLAEVSLTSPRAVAAGRLVSSSATLGEGLLHSMRLSRLADSSLEVSLHTDGEWASVAIAPVQASFVHGEVIEMLLAVGVLGARALTRGMFSPVEVCLSGDPPRDTRHHERVFQAPCRFGGVRNACYFDSALLNLPLHRADRDLNRKLVGEARERLGAATETDFPRRVRSAIARELAQGDASCQRIADRMGMHPRALSRRLRDHDISFRDLLQSVRQELAERLLREPGARVAQVALRLGYGEKSSFNRAFKEWSGCSPETYRRRVRTTGSRVARD